MDVYRICNVACFVMCVVGLLIWKEACVVNGVCEFEYVVFRLVRSFEIL